MKICTDCKKSFDESNFYSGSAKCKPCYRARVKANRESNAEYYKEYDRKRAMLPHRVKARSDYQKTEAGKAAVKRARQKWLSANPVKRAAQVILGNAVRDGKIDKPDLCEQCQSGGRIHGHHDDYAKPLEVRWLCASCHNKWHEENGEALNG